MRALPGRDAVGHFAGARGGAHQSVATPLIGIGQPELLSFEPRLRRRETAEILRFAFNYLQSDDGSSCSAVDQDDRAAGTRDDRGLRARSRWRLLAARPTRAGSRWSARRDPARAFGRRCARRRSAGSRDSGDHFGRPVARGLARCAGAAGAGRDRQRRDRAAAGAARRGCRAHHRARRPPGDARLARQRRQAASSTRSGSTASASPATFPICIAFIGSMPTRSSIAWRSPAPNAPDAPRPDGAAAPSDPFDPVAGRLRPRRQQRRRPAAAALGFDVFPLNTVQLAHHPGYGAWRGLKCSPSSWTRSWAAHGPRRARSLRGCAQQLSRRSGCGGRGRRAVAAVRAAHLERRTAAIP